MPHEQIERYEFGDFELYPNEKLLFHFDKRLPLPGRDFEILSYLVQHADTFVSKKEIIENVWGPDVSVTDSNMSHLMAKIRKVIGCDARKPKYIRTIYNKDGYRFIAKVQNSHTERGQLRSAPRSNGSRLTYDVASHLFVPVFVGEGSYERLNLPLVRNDWVEYKERKTESGRLCLSPSGFGIWHLKQDHQIHNLSEISAWRKNVYYEILNRKHPIRSRTNEIIKSMDADKSSTPAPGVFGYVFSVILFERSSLKRQETTRNALKTLASLSVLEANRTETAEIEKREQSLLLGEIRLHDLVEFGHSNVDLGFAGWDGVSYVHSVVDGNTTSEKLVEFEIVVQTLWWACKCVIDMRLANDGVSSRKMRNFLTAIRRNYAQIRTILATESPSQRSMVEAILKTSRIQQMVEAALDDN